MQFFEAIAPFKDLSKNLGLVQILGDSCLDEATVSAFIAFVNQNLEALIPPEAIINSIEFEKEVISRLDQLVKRQTLRVDILAAVCTRLVNHISLLEKPLTEAQVHNLKRFMKISYLPNDLRFALARDLMSLPDPALKILVADPEIGSLYMNKI